MADIKDKAGAMPAIGIGMDIANAIGGWFGGNKRQEQQYKYQSHTVNSTSRRNFHHVAEFRVARELRCSSSVKQTLIDNTCNQLFSFRLNVTDSSSIS